MKRKRPLLFDVLGSDEQPRQPRKPEKPAPSRRKARRSAPPSTPRSSSSGTPPRPRAAPRPRRAKPAPAARPEPARTRAEPPRREIRVSQQLGAVIAAVAVVFVGLSYYLGTLHGGSQVAGGRLAKVDRVEPRNDSAPAAPERFWAVQVATLQWRRPAEKEVVLARCRALMDHLRSRGYPEVMGRLNRARSQLAVYVGRNERGSEELRELLSGVKREVYDGRRQFEEAYITLLDAPGTGRASPDDNR